MSEQLSLDLDFFTPDEDVTNTSDLRPDHLRRAAAGWLLTQAADGIGLLTPTRVRRFKADVAAFWNRPKPNGSGRGPHQLLVPCRTALVECRVAREQCWPDFANSSRLLPRLRSLKQQRRDLQSEIRDNEPELRDSSMLFDDMTEWAYDRSQNPSYQETCREIMRIEHALYNGTRFESMRGAAVADRLYLAVPEGLVQADELADGWGLLWVSSQLEVQLVIEAEERDCPAENRFHFVQNIAASCLPHVLFSQGIQHVDEAVVFGRKPRRRRAPRPGQQPPNPPGG